MTSHVLVRCSPSELFTHLRRRDDLGVGVECVLWDPPRRAVLARSRPLLGRTIVEIMVDPGANGSLVHVTERPGERSGGAAPLRMILEQAEASRLRRLSAAEDPRAGRGPAARTRLLIHRVLSRRLTATAAAARSDPDRRSSDPHGP